jgi:uncharacterized RDD family membrane protein YckC
MEDVGSLGVQFFGQFWRKRTRRQGAATAHGLIRIVLVMIAALAFILGLVVIYFLTGIPWMMKKALKMIDRPRKTR